MKEQVAGSNPAAPEITLWGRSSAAERLYCAFHRPLLPHLGRTGSQQKCPDGLHRQAACRPGVRLPESARNLVLPGPTLFLPAESADSRATELANAEGTTRNLCRKACGFESRHRASDVAKG